MGLLRTILFGGVTALMLAACGGDNEREFVPETSPPTTPGAVVPASVELTKSAPSISSDGRQSVRLFATVKDAGNVAMVDLPVAFSASGTGSSITVVNGTTDANGQAEASLAIDDITDPWLRQAIQNEAVRRWGPRQQENTHGR